MASMEKDAHHQGLGTQCGNVTETCQQFRRDFDDSSSKAFRGSDGIRGRNRTGRNSRQRMGTGCVMSNHMKCAWRVEGGLWGIRAAALGRTSALLRQDPLRGSVDELLGRGSCPHAFGQQPSVGGDRDGIHAGGSKPGAGSPGCGRGVADIVLHRRDGCPRIPGQRPEAGELPRLLLKGHPSQQIGDSLGHGQEGVAPELGQGILLEARGGGARRGAGTPDLEFGRELHPGADQGLAFQKLEQCAGGEPTHLLQRLTYRRQRR